MTRITTLRQLVHLAAKDRQVEIPWMHQTLPALKVLTWQAATVHLYLCQGIFIPKKSTCKAYPGA